MGRGKPFGHKPIERTGSCRTGITPQTFPVDLGASTVPGALRDRMPQVLPRFNSARLGPEGPHPLKSLRRPINDRFFKAILARLLRINPLSLEIVTSRPSLMQAYM